MCNNRGYTQEEQQELDLMGKCASYLLQGYSRDEAADAIGKTRQDVDNYIEKIKDINPDLYSSIVG